MANPPKRPETQTTDRLPPMIEEIDRFSTNLKTQESLEELIEILGERKVVLLGESTHGTAEFYQWRLSITKILLQDFGFDFVAIEGDFPETQKVNDYILRDEGGGAYEVINQFERWPRWMWRNSEIPALVEWQREHRTPLYGLDIYSLYESIESLLKTVSKYDPELAEKMRKRYSCFDPYEPDGVEYAQSLREMSEGCQQEALKNLQDILRSRIPENANGETALSAEQNARIIQSAERYYRTLLSPGPDSWNIRDEHMVESLAHLLDRHGHGSRAVVWAHNSHVGDYRATDMVENGLVSLGGLARERFGKENVALVGFGTYKGQVLAAEQWGGAPRVMRVPEAKPDSIDEHYHHACQEAGTDTLLSIFDSRAREGLLGERMLQRAIGVVYNPDKERSSNYVPTRLSERYDAFIFIDETTALSEGPDEIFQDTKPGRREPPYVWEETKPW